MRIVASGASIVLLVVASIADAAPAQRPTTAEESWADPRHGWAHRGEIIASTEDGGRTWRAVFDGQGADLGEFFRASDRAGVVLTDPPESIRYWTADNGRRWFVSRRLPNFADLRVEIEGHGRFLFWSFGGTLKQVVPWPARGRCLARFERPPRGGRICHRAREVFRNRVVARIVNGVIVDLDDAPAGILALARRGSAPTGPFVRIASRRYGRTQIVSLPSPGASVEARVGALSMEVSWPRVLVLGEEATTNRPIVRWRSSNGGRTWQVAA